MNPLVIVILICSLITACGSSAPKATESKGADPKKKVTSWASPPPMTINKSKTYLAKVSTSKGDFTIQLFAKEAPITVNNFVFLSKMGYFDGVIFHRIMQSFMIQTGDLTGTGTGGPGYSFQDELNSPYKYDEGIVAMANSGANTNGSQFFICTGPDSKNLDQMPNYTIFGKISAGMDTVKKIAATPVSADPNTGESSHPTEKVTINSVSITEQ